MKKACFLFFAFLFSVNVIGVKIVELTVEAGSFDRYDTPLGMSLEGVTHLPDSALVLYEWEGKEKQTVPFQIETTTGGRTLSWVLSGHTPAGKKRTFTLESGTSNTFSPAIDFVRNDEELVLYSGEDRILAYHYAEKQPPKGTLHEYRRSGFIHPLWSPSGTVLTDIQPADHIHHYGIMNPWTKTTFEGKEVDFWNLAKGQGTVRFKAFTSFLKGPVFGGFQLAQEHVVFARGYEKTALNELLTVRIWNVKDSRGNKAWLWDYVTTQNCASDSALLLNEYRYGGLLFRGTPEWTNNTSEILTSEGKTRLDADGSVARWMLCSGKTPGGYSTVLILSSPSNFNHPEPIRVWPENSKYIFMNFSPTKDCDWLLSPGTDYTRKYRIVVVDGKMSKQEAEQYWRDYADSPRIAVRK